MFSLNIFLYSFLKRLRKDEYTSSARKFREAALRPV
jgi:hypothetical protein